MTTNHDAQTVLDAALLPSSMLATIIATYRDLAEHDRKEGRHDLANYSTARADALEWGGRITLGMVTP